MNRSTLILFLGSEVDNYVEGTHAKVINRSTLGVGSKQKLKERA